MSVGALVPLVLLGYVSIGALVALPFAFFGAPRVVDGAEGSSLAFRAMIVPGAALLWPLVLVRWAQAARGGAR